MSEAKNQGNNMVRLTVTLLSIAAVCSLLLGMVNAITKDPIAQAKENKKVAAMAEVLAAEVYEPVAYTGSDVTIIEIYKAGDLGHVVEVGVSGFGGTIDMMVGVDTSGICTGVSIVSMAETAGLGANASKEDFRTQFVGQSGDVRVAKDGGMIDSLTGATITSRAVADGVTSALNAVALVG